VLHDQATFWSAPIRAPRRKETLAAIPVAAGLGAMLATDRRMWDGIAARSTSSSIHDWRRVSDLGNACFTIATPLAAWSAGTLLHRPALQKSGGLMIEAVTSATLETSVLKVLTGRARPLEPHAGRFNGLDGPEDARLHRDLSFPSGHAAGAFALATVISGRTRHAWVRWSSYAVASVIGFSRIGGESHFPGDVAAGAVLGFATGKIVLHHHPVPELGQPAP
jgi:undecaprenyl-diphosphatase